MRRLQIVPKPGFRLYGALVAKEVELSRKNRGTLRRSGRKLKERARWEHKKYPGWLKLTRGAAEVVDIEVRSTGKGEDWQLLRSILGFIDRHFGNKVRVINIQYGR